MPMEIKETEFENKVIEASKKKTILVDFWAPWCGPCLAMAPILEELAKELHSKVTVVKVNVDNNQQLSAEYNIRSIPTLIIFKDGKPIHTEIGLKSKDYLTNILNA